MVADRKANTVVVTLLILIATLLTSMNAIHKVEHVIMAFANPALTAVVCNVLVN
ncbi:hypothetical protein RhiirA1_486913 [Rhizophagus irregularis]|uniref:Uncharacterized protein n=1 Tax=Rhizophagus irregularis TaxID=588596 RepID=A0A2I1FDY0_9GLOM|nr:hypothetical protein RhiirA1_486913 [Rhizophagus irregularis]PKY32583.1 hypothetical protein RhiirB3_450868 [Rhizophagus irregularis]